MFVSHLFIEIVVVLVLVAICVLAIRYFGDWKGAVMVVAVLLVGCCCSCGNVNDYHGEQNSAAQEQLGRAYMGADVYIKDLESPWPLPLAPTPFGYAFGYADLQLPIPSGSPDPNGMLAYEPCIVRFALKHDDAQGWYLVPGSGRQISAWTATTCPSDFNSLIRSAPAHAMGLQKSERPASSREGGPGALLLRKVFQSDGAYTMSAELWFSDVFCITHPALFRCSLDVV